MTETETRALSYLPERLREAVIRKVSPQSGNICEIRLRENRLLSLTINGSSISCDTVCTKEEIRRTVAELCGNSLYSHSEAIRDGCITTDCGIRAGVCGHAVLADGRVTLVRDITSVNIRIPHRVPGAADRLYALTVSGGGVLVYSAPGMGKTTVLRELIPRLASGTDAKRTAVIDTRYELCTGETEPDLTDVFFGYPRYEGILAAVRTMSPEYIVCDEISSERDVQSLLYAHSAGIAVCASVHAESMKELMRNTMLTPLLAGQVFRHAYGIRPEGIRIDLLGEKETCPC